RARLVYSNRRPSRCAGLFSDDSQGLGVSGAGAGGLLSPPPTRFRTLFKKLLVLAGCSPLGSTPGVVGGGVAELDVPGAAGPAPGVAPPGAGTTVRLMSCSISEGSSGSGTSALTSA